MNIITNSDIKKFLTLVKEGLKKGTSKDLRIHSRGTCSEDSDAATKYYVSVEFSFDISSEYVEEALSEDFITDEEIDKELP